MRGNVIESTAAQKRHVATLTTVRRCEGHDDARSSHARFALRQREDLGRVWVDQQVGRRSNSAQANGTGPSPTE